MPRIRVRGSSVATSSPELEQQFVALREVWRSETLFVSSVTDIVGHPAYEGIIQLGSGVIPLILRDLRAEPAHWFVALRRLASEDAALGETTVKGAADAWLRWGAKHDLID